MPRRDRIGARLRSARERAGLSREALAFHSGVSWSAITQIESGRRTNVRPRTLAALAGALGVTADYLIASTSVTGMLEHRALLYDTEDDFFAFATPFLDEAVNAAEAAFVVTSAHRIRRLRRQLGSRAKDVKFAERLAWYTTPTSALTEFRQFLSRATDDGANWARILGEPVWAGRSGDDVRLWARYESMLNLIFSGAPATMVCAYCVTELDPRIVAHARATHPHTVEEAELRPSDGYIDPGGFVLETPDRLRGTSRARSMTASSESAV